MQVNPWEFILVLFPPFNASLHGIDLTFSLNLWSNADFHSLYYYMKDFCNLIGLEQWYFSLI